MLLVLSFEDNISTEVNRLLRSDKKCIIASSEAGIQAAINYIELHKPEKVLALGMYSGRDIAQCRLEVFCSSRFRNRGTRKKVPIRSWLQATPFRLSNGMGNSWCNKLCYSLTTRYPDLPLSFVHIPKSYDKQCAANNIESALHKI